MADAIQHYKTQVVLARTEIKNLRQQLVALKHEHLKEIQVVKNMLNSLRCGSCTNSATTLEQHPATSNSVIHTSTSTSATVPPSLSLSFQPIGVIETSFQNKRGVPRQPTVMAKAKGTLVIDTAVFNNPGHALSGLEEFSHMWIIFHFHCTEAGGGGGGTPAKVAPPRLAGARRGVLSTRAPHRPCPIGLSLVRIQSIEGNKIHFLGVDMVNGTPVLDIKPYIPQYDYPAPFGDNISSLERPPTEGTSDAADAFASLTVDDDGYDVRSLSPRLTHPMGIDTSNTLPPSPFQDNIPSPGQPELMTPVSPLPNSPTDNLRNVVPPLVQPDTERGSPDGQERFTPPQTSNLANITQDGIRVAAWIENPPAQVFEVRFTEDVDVRLVELIGDRAQTFKNNIQSLLSDDPRSNYVRTRYPDHEYSCVLEDLSISCVFDSSTSICTIIAVRNAEEMQT